MKKELQKETSDLLAVLTANWSKIRDYYYAQSKNRASYETQFDTLIGGADWDNPDIAWLLFAGGGGGYEGWGTQIGLTKDGRLVWEYQSHCSCNDFSDSNGEGAEIPEDTKKTYEFTEVPSDWESAIRENARKIIKELNLSSPPNPLKQ